MVVPSICSTEGVRVRSIGSRQKQDGIIYEKDSAKRFPGIAERQKYLEVSSGRLWPI